MKKNKLNSNPFRNKSSYAKIIFSYFAFRPMFNMVTICAQNLKVTRRIIFSVFINMMNDKAGFVFISTFITRWGAVFFYRFCKAYYRIFNFCFNRIVCYRRASSRAKFSLSALIGLPSCYYFFTNLARMPLAAGKGTINSIFIANSDVANFKISSTSCTFFLSNAANISAFFRTIYLPNTLSGVVSFKLFLANGTCIHNGGYHAFA